MLRTISTLGLAPLRWAVRFELQRSREADGHDAEYKAFQEFTTREHLAFDYLTYNCKSEQVCVKITGRS